jgi:hypothetical protein
VVDIKIDVRGLADVQRELARLAGREKDRAMAAAINKVAEKGRVEIRRAITDRYAIKAEEVRSALGVNRASAKGLNLEARIDIWGSKRKRGRSLNMIHFLAALAQGVKTRGGKAKKADIRALAGQLGFQITRAGGVKEIKGAFVGNRGRTVFQRVGKGRLPIKPVQVIGVSQMFNSREINERVMKRIESEFGTELRRAVEMVIAKR